MHDDDFRLATPDEIEKFERDEEEWRRKHPGAPFVLDVEPEKPPFHETDEEKRWWKKQLKKRRSK